MGQKITGFIFVALLIVIVVFAMLSQGKQDSGVTDAIAKLYDKIVAYDLDDNYPDAPSDVIRINNEITRYLYSGHANDSNVASVVLVQRKLMGKELLELNPEYEQVKAVEDEVKVFKDSGYSFISLSQLPPDYYEDNTKVCSIRVTQYTNFKETPKNYVIYYLGLQSDGKWKIMGWELSENAFPESEAVNEG